MKSPIPIPNRIKSLNPPIRLLQLKSKRLILLTMVSLISLSILSLLLLSSDTGRTIHPQIRRACTATRFPEACQAQLSESKHRAGPAQIALSALSISAQYLNKAQSMAHNIPHSEAALTCHELLSLSSRRASAASSALSRDNLTNARAWASAALVYQYDCWSALKYVNKTAAVAKTMSFLNDTLIVSASNALSLLAALAGSEPRTERDGFWEPVSGLGSELGLGGGIPARLEPDATVCGAGCDFEAVQPAVESAPSGLEGGKMYVVYIKEGVYEEIVRVGFEKRNLVFVGDGIGRTVITGALSKGIMGISTYNTATLGVFGDGFMATNLTVQNTAGPNAHQAVAFRSDSDFSLIENCEFLGNQDTLYAHSLRQLYKSCRIEGNVDFIFGMAAAVFQECTILIRLRQGNPGKGATNVVTAHGRTDPAQTTGFVFLGCVVNGTDEYLRVYSSKPRAHKNYLGRPWKDFSRTVFIRSTLGGLIMPTGWLPWRANPASMRTLYYGEYENVGPGANLLSRVPWSSRIPAEHVATYSARNFIQADEYLSTLAGLESKQRRKDTGK